MAYTRFSLCVYELGYNSRYRLKLGHNNPSCLEPGNSTSCVSSYLNVFFCGYRLDNGHPRRSRSFRLNLQFANEGTCPRKLKISMMGFHRTGRKRCLALCLVYCLNNCLFSRL